MEFGLCCLFTNEPIQFRSYTHAGMKKLACDTGESAVREKILAVWNSNIDSVQLAIRYCVDHKIAGFRISSDIFPQTTRMVEQGFVNQSDLDDTLNRLSTVDSCGIVLSLHPGQHVNLGSPDVTVVENSLVDLNEHFAVAHAIGASEINIHVGGSYGDKVSAARRFSEVVSSIPQKDRALLTLENDELNYSIDEVITIASQLNCRVVYDIHHQRCHELKYAGKSTEYDYYIRAKETWPKDQIQRLHLSSPRDGFVSITKARPHSDFIDPRDIPDWLWEERALVDIEAKKKELAIAELQKIQHLRSI